ncbi:hypothetical protein QR680_004148 [Steinernema hermaphroditum]|uniref:Serpin domain-containing protein n=1 Tax=Steinernema hermaphroditum TaxID=289476 RepID=A0AA39HMT6_9BILA|nr:hypothetical protein QR680_004148 [Steinernema hermaphroditum]
MKVYILLFLLIGGTSNSPVESNVHSKVNDALFRFSLKFLKEQNKEISVMSPFSLAMAMAMVNDGAKGETSQQVTDVIFNGIPKDEINYWYKTKLSELNRGKSPMALAARVYIEKSEKILKPFLDSMTSNFHSELVKANFRYDSDTEKKNINNFVNESTRGHIPELIPQGAINTDTKLIPVNALYMESKFQTAFEKYLTGPANFTNENGTMKQVTTMNMPFDGIEYKDDPQFKYTELPFEDDGFAFFILVPKERNLTDFISDTLKQKEPIAKSLRSPNPYGCSVDVTVPKFNVSSSPNSTNALKSIGVKTIFQERLADLSGINGRTDLYVKGVDHKATLDLTETGIKASAATAVRVDVFKSGNMCFGKLEANRPFLYGITHKGTPLFVGQYY